MLTLSALKRHALLAVGGGVSSAPGLTKDQRVCETINFAGQHLFARPWRFRERSVVATTPTGDPVDVLELAADVGEVIEVVPVQAGAGRVDLTTMVTIERMRRYASSSGQLRWVAVEKQPREDGTWRTRLALWPTISAGTELVVRYRTEWPNVAAPDPTAVPAVAGTPDSTVLPIPEHVEALLIAYVRAYAQGFEDDGLEQRIAAIDIGPVFDAATRRDGMLSETFGQLQPQWGCHDGGSDAALSSGGDVVDPEGDCSCLVWRGHYDSNAAYPANSLVEYNGSAWIAPSDVPAGIVPPEDPWDLFAAAGAQGPGGLTGLTGPTGPAGPAGGAPTSSSYVTLSLDSSLSAERVLTAGAGLTLVDGGANGNATISVADNGVTLAKMADIATDRLLGRDTAATGDPETLTVGGGVEFTGSGGIQRSALTGDVTASAGSNATTIANNAVTLAKMADVATGSLLGRSTAGTGDPEVITVGSGLILSAGILVASGGAGSPGGSNKQIQYNNSSAFGGVSGFSFESASTQLLCSGLEFALQASGIDTQPWLVINDNGNTRELRFGSGSATPDVNLYRGAANVLQTDDQIVASDGIRIPVIPGTVDDSSFTVDADGLLAINSVSEVLYARVNGAWIAVGGGTGAPTNAQYVTLATHASLSAERVLTAGAGLALADGGANGNATLSVADNGVTLAKMADLATDVLLGRDTTGTGDPETLTVGGGVEFSGSGGIRRSALTGDVTASAGSNATTIANDAVTLAKMANMATGSLLGRSTAGTGDPEVITVGSGLILSAGILVASGGSGDVVGPASSTDEAVARFDGATGKLLQNSGVTISDAGDVTIPNTGLHLLDTNASHDLIVAPGSDLTADRTLTVVTGDTDRTLSLIGSATISGTNTGDQTITLTSDVTGTGSGSFATTIANNAVTLAKMADVATDRLLGRDTTGTGDPEALTVGGGVEFTGSGGIQRSALTGDVTASAGSNATTIANNAVTLAKMADIATDRLLGRDTAATGDPEALTVGGGIEFTGSGGIQRSALTGDVTASAGSNATTIANDAVTLAKMANMATGSLLGRSTAGTGDPEIITVGSGLVLSSGTLVASGGGGSPGGSNKQFQYNNSGAFGGLSGFTYESGSSQVLLSGLELGCQASGIDTQPWLVINDNGNTRELRFGSGSATPDVNLYRGAANVLQTDDQIVASDGIRIPVIPGTVDDSSFTVDADGLLAINSVSEVLYARVNGAWIAVGGGTGAPTNAQYVTLATNASLSAERVLTAGTGLTLADGGANGNATLANAAVDAFTTKGDLFAATTADAGSRLAAGTNEQSLVADSAQSNGLKYAWRDRLLQDDLTADGTAVVNTTTATILDGTTVDIGSMLNVLQRQLRLTYAGKLEAAGSSHTCTFRLKWNNTTLLTTIGTFASALTGEAWNLSFVLTCRQTGASGKLQAAMIGGQTYRSALELDCAETSGIDFTDTAADIRLEVQWSNASASNSIKLSNIIAIASNF